MQNQPLAHFGRPVSVGPLRPQAAADLVAHPMEAARLRVPAPELVSRILAICNNQPSLIVLFMNALVNRLLPVRLGAGQPPVVVTGADVDATYASSGAGRQIKDRFELTLDLDPAYKVIAYTVAWLAHMKETLVTAGDLRHECAEWWPQGFAGITVDGFRTLCDEMVGLGVLSSSDGGYRLRSPNVLRLLGSKDTIEETLVEASSFEPSEQFEASALRPSLPLPHGQRRIERRSPLTVSQLHDLLAPRAQARVVVGSRANGLDLVAEALRASACRRLATSPSGDLTGGDWPACCSPQPPVARRLLW